MLRQLEEHVKNVVGEEQQTYYSQLVESLKLLYGSDRTSYDWTSVLQLLQDSSNQKVGEYAYHRFEIICNQILKLIDEICEPGQLTQAEKALQLLDS